MKVIIETVPHEHQRYPTVGDYWVDPDGTLRIWVSDMKNSSYESMVAVHELWEAILVLYRGISTQAIDDFDKAFESKRSQGNFDEPGDEPSAPYHREHCSATGVERLLCSELNIPWKTYEETVNAL